MKKKNAPRVVFKAYDQQQSMLLPPTLDELIAANHPVHVVNKVLDKIDIQPLANQYKAGVSCPDIGRLFLVRKCG